MNILKSLLIWLCFIPVAVLNGGLREYVLVKMIGDKWALPVSGIILSVCIFLITLALLPRAIKACTSKDCWLTGICWAVMTVVFELAAVAAGSNTAEELKSSCPGAEIRGGRLLNGNPSRESLEEWVKSVI